MLHKVHVLLGDLVKICKLNYSVLHLRVTLVKKKQKKTDIDRVNALTVQLVVLTFTHYMNASKVCK